MKYLALIFIMLLTSCNKNGDSPVQHSSGWDDADQVNATIRGFLDDQAPLAQTFTIDPSNDNEFVTAGGIRFAIPKGNFYNDAGEKITNIPVGITLFEYFTNRDLITGNISTAASGQVLSTSGVFTLYANGKIGEALHIRNPIGVTVPSHGAVSANALVFSGSENRYALSNRVVWTADTVGLHNAALAYGFSLREMKWYHIGSNLPDPANKTSDFTVKLPIGYGNQNSVCFLLLPNRGAIQLLARPQAEVFSSGGYEIPVGQSLKVFTIGYKDAQFSYNLQSTTIMKDQQLTIDSMQTAGKATLTNVIAYGLD